jgi:hypothetical protein
MPAGDLVGGMVTSQCVEKGISFVRMGRGTEYYEMHLLEIKVMLLNRHDSTSFPPCGGELNKQRRLLRQKR